jgi:hypothetical protein
MKKLTWCMRWKYTGKPAVCGEMVRITEEV